MKRLVEIRLNMSLRAQLAIRPANGVTSRCRPWDHAMPVTPQE
ncbi:hypothetical protein JMJ77_0004457 [Colletotrichum scovillei]|uniref:Uncharacterized protein n=1 Tax=Colletotrichum scovillei TaxID=1209932 RepID=A0A9P7QYL9_9PEZI|nr:hypothetical protein JMJ77_0004457 [Colletotrichum scovillei]KAG7049716.1 hypothetical protein JMJ78_0013695 [Colletotrichum scovillei]KAG7064452.1 hypothetical protein JMJ76_0007496 [Colletotrichum scovillei]